jgi:nucleoside-diphosphate-sugar epimerase
MSLLSLSNEKVVVTGGAGFVGSNLVRVLQGMGAKVVVMDDFFTGREDNVPAGVELVRASVCDFAAVREVIQGATVVFHEAARNIVVSTKNPREDYETNIGGTLNVLLAVKEAPSPIRVVYAGSASVYGNPRTLPINEDDVTNMLSPYAVSKYSGENYCRAFYESYGVWTTVVRYSNVYGRGQRADNPYCGVVAKFFESALAGGTLRIHGDGEQTRDFTYIDDAVAATVAAGLNPKAEGQVYNVATGREATVTQVARHVIAITGSKSQLEFIDRRDIDNIRRRVCNIEKIRRELRWVPSVTLEEGLRRTYAWIKETQS